MFNWRTRINDNKSNNTRNINALTLVISPVTNNLFLVRSTCLSKFTSSRSLTTQPAALIKIVPTIKINNKFNCGICSDAIKRAANVGHRSKKIPIGLSNLARISKFFKFFKLIIHIIKIAKKHLSQKNTLLSHFKR